MRNRINTGMRAVAITLLIAMVYYIAGYRIVYSVVMQDAKKEASWAIQHHGALTSLVLSENEYASLAWTEKNKEFSYNGQLFDLVSMKKTGNSYVMTVYNDKNETYWAKAMNDFVKFLFPSGNSKKSGQAEGLMSAFQKEYIPLENSKADYTPETTKVIYSTLKNNREGLLLIKPIWHPPASC